MTPLVLGNWKLNGTLSFVNTLIAGLKPVAGVDVGVCVPLPYLGAARTSLRDIGLCDTGLGAQTVSEFNTGAYTGEVSAAMLAEFGCRWVIVGHSERRALFGEDDAMVGRKALRALASGIQPVVCVGETLAQREAGQVWVTLERQLGAVLAEIGPEGLSRSVVAYEPVWAIGTGRAASRDEAQEVHAFIRRWLDKAGVVAEEVPLLYGGSVKPENAKDLFAMPDVNGGLIGGSALVASDFMVICQAAGAV